MELRQVVHPSGPAQRPVAAADLDQLAAQLQQLASGWNLRIVPATPVSTAGSCQLVLLGCEDLSAAEFCELAASAGMRLLYAQAESFDAETDPDLNLLGQARDHQGSARDLLADLHRDAQRYNGRVRQLELAFAVGCVLHCWAAAADWYTGLVDRAAALALRGS
jgi:hypothetical protein